MPEFNYAMMVFGESGIYETPAFNYGEHRHIKRELFYLKPDLVDDLNPFGLRHTVFQFIFLAVGLCGALLMFMKEKQKRPLQTVRNKNC